MLREEQKNYLKEGHRQYQLWKEKFKNDPYFYDPDEDRSSFIRAIKHYMTCLRYPDQYDMVEVNLSLARAYTAFAKYLENICSYTPSIFGGNSPSHLDFVSDVKKFNGDEGELYEYSDRIDLYDNVVSCSKRKDLYNNWGVIFSFNKNINIITAICHYANILERYPTHPEAEFELALLMGQQHSLADALKLARIREEGYNISAYGSIITIKPKQTIHIVSNGCKNTSFNNFHHAQIVLPKIIKIIESAMKAPNIYEIKDFIEILMQLHYDSLAVYEINEKGRIEAFLKGLKICKSVREYVETSLLQNIDPTYGTIEPNGKMIGLLYFILSPIFEIKFNECKSIKKIMAARLFKSNKKNEMYLLNRMCKELHDLCDSYSKDYYFKKNPHHDLTVVIAMCCHKLQKMMHPIAGRFKDEEMKVKFYLYALVNLVGALHIKVIKDEDEKLWSALSSYINRYQFSAWIEKVKKHKQNSSFSEPFVILEYLVKYHNPNGINYYTPKNVIEKLLLYADKNIMEIIISVEEIEKFMSRYAAPLQEKKRTTVSKDEKAHTDNVPSPKTNMNLVEELNQKLGKLCESYQKDYILMKNPNHIFVMTIALCCFELKDDIQKRFDYANDVKMKELFYLYSMVALVKALAQRASDTKDEKLQNIVDDYIAEYHLKGCINQIKDYQQSDKFMDTLSAAVSYRAFYGVFDTDASSILGALERAFDKQIQNLTIKSEDFFQITSLLRAREGTGVGRQMDLEVAENKNATSDRLFSL